ncbi:hypothetical protein Pcinc_025114 [Petrolisthes cinctipes]|uniref:Uncharacterized protein n=1 Tax=Petrolisthes cinctipes TaxID=88211 RepID=A0AAE1F9D5_PETCI|nr:hypothetical protein Pcinc_025114 [Petrolisthes cinctipes]
MGKPSLQLVLRNELPSIVQKPDGHVEAKRALCQPAQLPSQLHIPVQELASILKSTVLSEKMVEITKMLLNTMATEVSKAVEKSTANAVETLALSIDRLGDKLADAIGKMARVFESALDSNRNE